MGFEPYNPGNEPVFADLVKPNDSIVDAGLPENFGIVRKRDDTNPSVFDSVGSYFTQVNLFGFSAYDQRTGVSNNVDPDFVNKFDILDDIKGTKYEPYYENFLDSYNQERYAATKRNIDREIENRHIIEDSGLLGHIAGFATILLSPENFIPGSVFVKGAKGASALRRGYEVGRIAAGSTALAEAYLYTQQETRTIEEAIQATIFAGGLGFLLGSGFSALGKKAYKKNFEYEIDQIAKADKEFKEVINSGKLDTPEMLYAEVEKALARTEGDVSYRAAGGIEGSVGAAAHAPNIDDLTIYGKAAGYVAGGTKWLNPIVRLAHSSSPAARELSQELFDQPIYFRMNDYRPSSVALETIVRRYVDGIVPDILERVGTQRRWITGNPSQSLYAQMRAAGIHMSRSEFRAAIGRALRRGDTGENEFVSKAAKDFRDNLFTPMRKELEEHGFDIPKEASTTAESYFPRMWNIPELLKGEQDFKRITTHWLRGQVSEQIERQIGKLQKEVANLQRAVDDLNMAKLRRESDLQSKFGSPEDFAELSHLEDTIKAVDDIVQAISEGKPIVDLLRNLPDDIKQALGEVGRIIDADLSKEVADLARRILPRNVSVRLKDKVDIDGNSQFSLPGFKSKAIDTVETFKQEKASPQQWKALLNPQKTSGLKQDELDWMGVHDWLDTQGKSVSKSDLLNYMEAHRAKLDEKVLGEEGAGVTVLSREEKPWGTVVAFQDQEGKVEHYLINRDSGGQYQYSWIEDPNLKPEEVTDEFAQQPYGFDTFDQALHAAQGDIANIPDTKTLSSKFSDYSIPGGENYRELLIRLPELEDQYKSPHFQDQEIVHIRFDERTIDGKKVLFINEVQSDLHQRGRKQGYRTNAENELIKTLSSKKNKLFAEADKLSEDHDTLQSKLINELTKAIEKDHGKKVIDEIGYQISGNLFRVLSGEDPRFSAIGYKESFENAVKKIASRGDLERLRNWDKEADKLIREGEDVINQIAEVSKKYPSAPFKSDLWLELALKRMIKYANDNNFDAISWARADQIAEAVGGDAKALSVQYDQKIGKFLQKYTKKWGGKVENQTDIVPSVKDTALSSKMGLSGSPEAVQNQILNLTPELKKVNTQYLSIRDGSPEGAFNLPEALVAVSRSTLDPEGIVRHEAIHALRGFDLFTENEWGLLKKSAEELGWINKHNIHQRYEEVYGGRTDAKNLDDFLIEEAIADEFMQWRAGNVTVTDKIRKIFEKIQKFFEDLGKNLQKEGLKTYEDVFKRIESGEVANRLGLDEANLKAVRDQLDSSLDAVLSRFDESDAVNISESDVMSMLRTVQQGPPQEPQNLFKYIHSLGGLVESEAGELKRIGIMHGRQGVPPGFIRREAKGTINPKGGLTIDDAARAAWEDGFFPGTERPTVDEFLDALSDDFNGLRPVVRAADEEAARAVEEFRILEQELERLGIDNKRPRFESKGENARILRALNKAQTNAGEEQAKTLLSKMAKVEEDLAEAQRYQDPDLANEYASQIASEIFNTIRGIKDVSEFVPELMGTRGPLKHKIRIPDLMIERFLEDDVEHVAFRYARSAGSQLEFKRKFGVMDLKQGYFPKITDQYEAARERVRADDTIPAEEKDGIIAQLVKEEAAVRRELQFAQEKILGTYEWDQKSNMYTRAVDMALAFNYLRAMGGVLLSSLTDIFRTTGVHGFKAVFGDKGVKALMKGSKAVKMNRALAKKYAGIAEITSNSRQAMNMDLANPYSVDTPFEKFMQKATREFSIATGLPYWNQYLKEFVGHITIDRIIGNAMHGLLKKTPLERSEVRYMHMLGINEDIVRTLRQGYDQGWVKQIDGVWTIDDANKLGADVARDLFAGVSKDINSAIVTKGYGDVLNHDNIFFNANQPLGKLIYQFKSFAMATNQRILIRGLQEEQSKFLMTLAGMVTVGAFVYTLKQIESGRPVSDNPGTFLAEGLDRSGVFSVLFEMNNIFEKNGGPGVYSTLAALFPEASQRAPASRYAVRSQVGSFLGPSFGGATDIMSTIGIGSNAINPFSDRPTDLSPGDIKALRRLTPFVSLPYWRWLVDGHIVPHFQEEVR